MQSIQPPKTSSPLKRASSAMRAGFTLIELMVVIMIIVILSGIVITSMNGFNQDSGVNAGITRLDSLFSLARSAAITLKTKTRVLINFESQDHDSFHEYHPALRMVTIVYLADDGKWKVYTNPEYLDDGVFFSPALSTSTANSTPPLYHWDVDIDIDTLKVEDPPYKDVFKWTSAYTLTDGKVDEVGKLNSGPGPNRWLSFEFNSNGTFESPGTRVVVTNGILGWEGGQIAINLDLEEGESAEDNAKGFVVFRSGKLLHFQSAEQIKEGN
ncbi:prepilin-type N-terminal cleavage/methylation domain-containing protein [Kiritimatiellota bacterium B12222]|nr:prepilin-type N-terminal cleavage/methylation domain-containing protein [Kiritimatiellota bacterium B12222]